MSLPRYHTPCPWLITANGLNVKSFKDVMICFTSDEASKKEQKANAALIAAAPNMLSLIFQMKSFLETSFTSDDEQQKELIRLAGLVIAETMQWRDYEQT